MQHPSFVLEISERLKKKKKRYNFNKTFDTFENVRISTLSKNDKPFKNSLLYVITSTCHRYCYDNSIDAPRCWNIRIRLVGVVLQI